MSSSFSDPALILPDAIEFDQLNKSIYCIQRYDNHQGNIDNFIITAAVGSGSATEDAGAHRMNLLSGLTANNYGAYYSTSQYVIGAYHTVFNCVLSAIAVGTLNTEKAYIGFFNTLSAPANAIAFFWDVDEQWYCRTASQTSGATTDTLIADVVSNDHLSIIAFVRDGLPQVKFYVNGVLVATHTTNIETVFAMNFGVFARCVVNAIANKDVKIDYVSFEKYPLV